MNGKRQTNQQQLASGTDGRGETPVAATRGAEPSVAMTTTESPAFPEHLMEEVCSRENLQRAWKRVQENKGGPGGDGMTIGAAKAFLREHWPEIRLQLLDGNYQPRPVKRVEIPKPDGGVRRLGVPCVVDRLILSHAAGSSRTMGFDVLRAQLRVPAGTVGAPGRSPGTTLHRRGLQRCGGSRSGKIFRPS